MIKDGPQSLLTVLLHFINPCNDAKANCTMAVDAQQFERVTGECNKDRDNLGSSKKAATSYQWFALYSMSHGGLTCLGYIVAEKTRLYQNHSIFL
jgi:hypothetical protein